jgi:ribokinase
MSVTGTTTPEAATHRLFKTGRALVIVTCGASGCWSKSAYDDAPAHYPAYEIDPVDTTGCGDVFHGVYAACLVRNMPLPDRITCANAAAALKAQHIGAQRGIPSRSEVMEFVAERSNKENNHVVTFAKVL